MKISKGDIFFFLTVGEKPTPKAKQAFAYHTERYGQALPQKAKVLCGLGGDGAMIRGIHAYWMYGKPFYGLNYGTVGYLLNSADERKNLYRRIEKAVPVTLSQLCVEAVSDQGDIRKAFAVNDVFICNHNRLQAIKLDVITPFTRYEIAGDGLIVASPVGSSGYTRSVGGLVAPLSKDSIVLTAAAPCLGTRFHSAIIDPCALHVTVRDKLFRPADVYNDQGLVLAKASSARVYQDETRRYTLLHDPHLPLKKKNLRLQFGQDLT